LSIEHDQDDEAEETEEAVGSDRDDGEPTEDDGEHFPNVNALLGTFLTEPSLWPVLVVMLASAGTFGAALLVLTGIDRNPFAALALLLLAGMTTDVLIRSRRLPGLRNVARMIGMIWGVAAVFAALAIWTGLAG
jgi:hypothetical protein